MAVSDSVRFRTRDVQSGGAPAIQLPRIYTLCLWRLLYIDLYEYTETAPIHRKDETG